MLFRSMVSKMICVVVCGFHVTQREILGFGTLCTVFRIFRERILRVRICMVLFDSFRILELYLGFHDVFIVLVSLERECSALFYCLAVRRKEEREFCIWGLHGFAWRYYGSGLIV